MTSEILKSAEDIKKETGNLQFKVSAIQAKKNEDIAKRILEVDTRLNETKKLAGLLKEAETNLEYYRKLDETGQLPEDEKENFSEAEGLVGKINAKMAEHNEAAEKIMTIPDVGGKIMEEAGEMNKGYNEKRAEEQKEKIMEDKFYQLFEKVINSAEELNQKQAAELEKRDEARKNLIKKIDEAVSDEKARKELKEILNYLFIDIEGFKNKVARHKDDLGLTKFFKKHKVNSLINSDELKQMEQAVEHFKEFLKDNKLERYPNKGLEGCVYAILEDENGAAQELSELFNSCFKKPFVSPGIILDKAYARDKQKFEQAGLTPSNIDSFRKRFDENSRAEQKK